MFHRRRAALFGLTFAGALSTAACGHRHHNPEKRAEWMTDKIANRLDLNEAQRQKLNAVKDEMLAVRKEIHKDRDQNYNELLAQLNAKELDQAKLQAIFDQKKTAVEQAAPRVIAKLAEFHATLNDEQKKELAEKLEDMREWHHD